MNIDKLEEILTIKGDWDEGHFKLYSFNGHAVAFESILYNKNFWQHDWSWTIIQNKLNSYWY